MRLLTLELRDFRNHRETRVAFDGAPTLLLGANGSGKTNVVEAIVLLSIGRSFRGSTDRELTRRGAGSFEVHGFARDAAGASAAFAARGGGAQPRILEVDGAAVPRLSALLGRFPTVHFSVDDVTVLNGGPGARRRFLDVALCQLEPAYVGFLREYVAALKQRNRLLGAGANGPGGDGAAIAVWEEILARSGVEIDARRVALGAELKRALQAVGGELDPGLEPDFAYRSGGGVEDADASARVRALEDSRARDARWGWTAEGPHRARLACRIGGEELAGGASRGMSRLYAILLRLALARVFEERRREPPVILLDDPESELDPRWIGPILELVPEGSQVVATACRALSESPRRFREVPMASIADVAAVA